MKAKKDKAPLVADTKDLVPFDELKKRLGNVSDRTIDRYRQKGLFIFQVGKEWYSTEEKWLEFTNLQAAEKMVKSRRTA